MGDEREITLREYGHVIWRRKWIVMIGLVMGLAGALAMSILQEPIYSAESQMLVEPRSGDAVFQQDPTLAVQNLDRTIQTEIQVLEGQRVRERVQRDLGLDQLPPPVDAHPIGATDVVSVNVRSADPQAAQILADAYVRAYISTRREQAIESLNAAQDELSVKVRDLQAQIDAADATSTQRDVLIAQQATFNERLDQLQIDTALTTGGASVVQSADLPEDPIEPKPIRSAVLASIVGLLLGLGAAFLVDFLDDSLRDVSDVERASGLPVLGVVPVKPAPDHRPIAISEPHDFAVEVYRGLRTSLQFLGLDRPLRIIQVTSSLPGEGKTTTASNLAVVLAQTGRQVALIDADLRKPRVHEIFSVPIRPGLTDTLLAGEAIDGAVTHLGHLHVMAAGTVTTSPSEMLASGRLNGLLSEFASRYDYVIVDSPPILPVADALALSRAVDGVLVVGEANRTSNRTLTECLSRLQQVGAPVVGIVLNRAAQRASEGYGYGYDYAEAPRRGRGRDVTNEIPTSTDDSLVTHSSADGRDAS